MVEHIGKAQFTGKDFKDQFCRPIVYIWTRGQDVMYVGKCKRGFQRIAYDHLHDVFKPREHIGDTDTVEIYYYDTPEECLIAERELIKLLDPICNFPTGRKTKDNPHYKADMLAELLPNSKTKEEKRREKMLRDLNPSIIERKMK